jgi:hypothetical protein
MEFEFLTALGRYLILEIVSELSEELLAGDHWAALLMLVVK